MAKQKRKARGSDMSPEAVRLRAKRREWYQANKHRLHANKTAKVVLHTKEEPAKKRKYKKKGTKKSAKKEAAKPAIPRMPTVSTSRDGRKSPITIEFINSPAPTDRGGVIDSQLSEQYIQNLEALIKAEPRRASIRINGGIKMRDSLKNFATKHYPKAVFRTSSTKDGVLYITLDKLGK